MKRLSKLVFIDIILIIFSLFLAMLLRFDFGRDPHYREYIHFLLMSIMPVLMLTLMFNKLFNLYNNLWEYASVEELLSVVYSVTLTNILFILYSYFVNYKLLKTTYFRFPFSVHIIFCSYA